MSSQVIIERRLDTLLQELIQRPDHRCRMKSKTFWGDIQIGRRSDLIVKRVKHEMQRRFLVVELETVDFGIESPDTQLTITYRPEFSDWGPSIRTSLIPADEWFDQICGFEYESEREVEVDFLYPLLQKLGYERDDIYMECPIQMQEGTKIKTKYADIVLYDGSFRDIGKSLLVCEAKNNEKDLAFARSEALSYANTIFAPAFLLTDGKILQVWFCRGPKEPLMKLNAKREEFKKQWEEIYKFASKSGIQSYKQELSNRLKGL